MSKKKTLLQAVSEVLTTDPIPREELKAAMEKDFEQHMIDSYTPDRGYEFPTDHVRALIAKYWPVVFLACLLAGCASTPNQIRDRNLYRAMQVERKALRLEEKNYNLTNVNALQDIIDRNGFERSRIEGYIP